MLSCEDRTRLGLVSYVDLANDGEARLRLELIDGNRT